MPEFMWFTKEKEKTKLHLRRQKCSFEHWQQVFSSNQHNNTTHLLEVSKTLLKISRNKLIIQTWSVFFSICSFSLRLLPSARRLTHWRSCSSHCCTFSWSTNQHCCQSLQVVVATFVHVTFDPKSSLLKKNRNQLCISVYVIKKSNSWYHKVVDCLCVYLNCRLCSEPVFCSDRARKLRLSCCILHHQELLNKCAIHPWTVLYVCVLLLLLLLSPVWTHVDNVIDRRLSFRPG